MLLILATLLATSATTATSDAALCATLNDERRSTCTQGVGVCVRCNDFGDPEWTWSDAPGAANAIRKITEPVDCKIGRAHV